MSGLDLSKFFSSTSIKSKMLSEPYTEVMKENVLRNLENLQSKLENLTIDTSESDYVKYLNIVDQAILYINELNMSLGPEVKDLLNQINHDIYRVTQ